MTDVLALACDLIARPSVTPEDAGCQALIAQRLQAAGFAVEHLRFGAVDNLWASHGRGGLPTRPRISRSSRMGARRSTGTAMLMSATSPPLKMASVGIERTPNLAARSGFSSMFSLAILTLPASSAEISSRLGAIILHGPHHSAQKSTTTGSAESRTSDWKLALSTFTVAMGGLLLCGRIGSGTM